LSLGDDNLANEIILQFDVDGDGKISYEEFEQMMLSDCITKSKEFQEGTALRFPPGAKGTKVDESKKINKIIEVPPRAFAQKYTSKTKIKNKNIVFLFSFFCLF